MIKFIQKYQKIFYAVITTVIVISFSFFGTYGTISGSNLHQQEAFKDLNGTMVTRGELEEMVIFLQSDSLDKRLYGFVWGPNFLNDGVIRKDFLETGMAEMLVEDYPDVVSYELDVRLQREKRFMPYLHPKASFISAENVWNYFSPSMKKNIDLLQKSDNALTPQALHARIQLYLSEKEFPAPYLTQVLRKQEAQYGWIEKDPALDQRDLSLFGYHSIDDWFGPKFSRLIAEFIFNAAVRAEQKGYTVSKEEAWADLVKNGAMSFQEISRAPDMNLVNQNDYVKEQLRRMGMDSNKATKIWQRVMLFRRLFHDIANSPMIETKSLLLTNTWANETIQGEFYTLPKALQFSDIISMAEFETYMAATSKGEGSQISSYKPLNVDAIAKANPELVEKRYLVVVKQADQKALQSRISMKDTLDWEIQEENFKLLKKEFADLGVKDGSTLDKRVDAIDSLSDAARNKVDSFARSKIVSAKKDWVQEALSQAKPEAKTLHVCLAGSKEPLAGIKDRKSFMQALDKATLNEEFQYPADSYVYEIKVIDRSPQLEVVSFDTAKANGSLGEILNKKLEALYADNKETKFKKSEGGFKSFADVKHDVAELWLESQLAQIKKETQNTLKDKAPQNLIADIAASLRFTGWADQIKKSNDKSQFVKSDSAAEVESDKLQPQEAWDSQFKWTKEEKTLSRGSAEPIFEKEKLFLLKSGETSPLITPANGALSFVVIKDKKAEMNPEILAQQTLALKNVIGGIGERSYMNVLLKDIKEKGAISFNYLNNVPESIDDENPTMNNDDV